MTTTQKLILLKRLFGGGGEPIDPSSDLVGYGRVDYMTLTE